MKPKTARNLPRNQGRKRKKGDITQVIYQSDLLIAQLYSAEREND
jgi:hypothetical protein